MVSTRKFKKSFVTLILKNVPLRCKKLVNLAVSTLQLESHISLSWSAQNSLRNVTKYFVKAQHSKALIR